LETQETPNIQGNTQQKEQCGGTTIPDFKLDNKTITIKTACTGTKTDMKNSGTE
jgi:hypothetical protein